MQKKNKSEILPFFQNKKIKKKNEKGCLYLVQTLEEYCSPEIQPSICALASSAFCAEVEYDPNYSDRQQHVKGPQAMLAWPCRHMKIIVSRRHVRLRGWARPPPHQHTQHPRILSDAPRPWHPKGCFSLSFFHIPPLWAIKVEKSWFLIEFHPSAT